MPTQPTAAVTAPGIAEPTVTVSADTWRAALETIAYARSGFESLVDELRIRARREPELAGFCAERIDSLGEAFGRCTAEVGASPELARALDMNEERYRQEVEDAERDG